jgi:hypothetical protein
MKISQDFIKRIETQTKEIKTTSIENVLANACLPLSLFANLLQHSNYSIKEIYDLNILGYKRLIKIQEKHGTLPTKLVRKYLSVPCGIAKICATNIRPYVNYN